jgi:ELWxxDGT repeat protein
MKRMTLMACAAVALAMSPATRAAGPFRLLTDIDRTPTFNAGSNANEFVALGNLTIFTARSPATGYEIWRTDGTAEGTSLLLDICPGPDSSNPIGLTVSGGTLYFSADDGIHGRELWKSDGTPAGTSLVKDIFSGPPGAFPLTVLTAFQGKVFFKANDGAHGLELWRSDGTEAGTVLVADINATSSQFSGTSGGEITLSQVGGALLFPANDGVHGTELWRTDGTTAGTILVKDIRPGSVGSLPGTFYEPTADGDVLYFQASDGVHGSELWRSDGTEAGTFLVKDVNPGTSGPVREIEIVSGIVFFTVDDGATGLELWRTDGTEQGTVLVKDIEPGPSSSLPIGLTEASGRLFFTASDGVHGRELWTSDGTEPGTVMVMDILPGSGGSLSSTSNKYRLAAAGGVLYFAPNDGVHGAELWRSDGTEAGTFLVKDVWPGPLSSTVGTGSGMIFRPTAVGDVLYFASNDGVHGTEPWKSDGTARGTALVKDVNPLAQTGAGFPVPMAEMGDVIYFDASDVIHGRELWRTDGTAAGTFMVKDINPGPASSSPADTHYPVVAGGLLFFDATDPVHGRELWRSDGTPSGTFMVKDIDPTSIGTFPSSSNPFFFAALGDVVLFAADDDDHGRSLWRSDGTEAGTYVVGDIEPGPEPSSIGPLTIIGGVAVFPASDNDHGLEEWRSDGTVAGTFLLADIRPGPASSLSGTGYDRADDGETLFFAANDGSHGNELWKTDGTPAGTVLVKDVDPGSPSGVVLRSHAFLDGSLFFLAHEFTDQAALWKSDGTEGGTILVKELHPSGFFYARLMAVGSSLFFNADDGVNGVEPWTSDGTEAGTMLIRDIAPGPASSFSAGARTPYFSESGGTVWFAADDGVHGEELWASDGTAAGTDLVADIRPGPDPSSVVQLSVIDGDLLLRADDGSHGTELWRTGGVSGGAVLVQDIAPGSAGSSAGYPFAPEPLGSRIVLAADDGMHGTELWWGWAAIVTRQPPRAVHDLGGELLKLGLPIGLEHVLEQSLDEASEALARSGGELEAIDALGQFEAQVRRLSRRLISEEDREGLLDFASQIVSLLEEAIGS